MPTKAMDSILYRDLSIMAAKNEIDRISRLVNHATNALVRCESSASGGIDEDTASLALYRHIIEMTDGIEVLLSNCCPVPAIPLLRSSFEANLSLEYLFESERDYGQRSLSWLVRYIHQRIEMYERLDTSSSRGQDFFADLKSDPSLATPLSKPSPKKIQASISTLSKVLSRPHIIPIEAEYQQQKRKPNWYQLFGGPNNIYELARHLKKTGQYDLLYRQWSGLSHSQDLSPFLARNPDGEAAIGRLRDASRLRQVATHASNYMLRATRLVIGKFRPGENLSYWYTEEVREDYLIITGANKTDD